MGHFDEFEKIIRVNVPVRGTLREVLIDEASATVARQTGELRFGTMIVMRDFQGVHVPVGEGFVFANDQLVAGKPLVALIQQKERGFGRAHPSDVRTGDRDFALYKPAGKPIPVNVEVACMPSHRRFEKRDYTVLVRNFFHDAWHREHDRHWFLVAVIGPRAFGS